MPRSTKKNYSALFTEKTSDSMHQQISELNEMIDVTTEYMETHNAVVTRLWEIQYNIAQHRAELANHPNHLDKNELKVLKAKLKKLETLAQRFHNSLTENRSAEIIDENLQKIEQLYNKLCPQHEIHFSSPVDLKQLKLA